MQTAGQEFDPLWLHQFLTLSLLLVRIMKTESKKFEEAVKGMDIPLMRKSGSPENARWFLRNGMATNRSHMNIMSAICHARRLA